MGDRQASDRCCRRHESAARQPREAAKRRRRRRPLAATSCKSATNWELEKSRPKWHEKTTTNTKRHNFDANKSNKSGKRGLSCDKTTDRQQDGLSSLLFTSLLLVAAAVLSGCDIRSAFCSPLSSKQQREATVAFEDNISISATGEFRCELKLDL